MKVALDIFGKDHQAVPGAMIESVEAADGILELANSVKMGNDTAGAGRKWDSGSEGKIVRSIPRDSRLSGWESPASSGNT